MGRPVGRNALESKEAMGTRFIKKIMDQYNSHNVSKVESMERELDQVGDLMKNNMQKVCIYFYRTQIVTSLSF